MPLTITSSAFEPGSGIPSRYTCDGDDRSPPLAWTGAPDGTQSFALLVLDPDAPDPRAPKRTWVHWVVYDLPADCRGLPEGTGPAQLPEGARQGLTDARATGYHGPCPPVGRHRYFFRLYALDTLLRAPDVLDRAGLDAAMEGHVLEKAELMGTYEKGGK